MAALNSATSALTQLISKGADVNCSDKKGMSPLHMARSGAAVEALLRAGATDDATNHQGQTALHTLSAIGATGAVEELLRRNRVSRFVRDNDGNTALDWALQKKHNDVARLLLQHPLLRDRQ
eukprot:TRINITY_DN12399_c0_g1_i1.p2 TRINITY_DN12399_c0_g1~~TRINITY_DN12399_c0_g1_i1.p2  ORF type:complete len:122 (-),score=16.72 TRINITY_DN12399_c0_g1_i1:76-441(-)